MARAPASDIPDPESDQLDGFAHPREATKLIGHLAAAHEAVDAFSSGRFHHAWILAGREGVGKATFAYAFAKFVLSKADERITVDDAPLAVHPDSQTNSLVENGTHPNILVIRRPYDQKTKKLKTVITVNEVRQVQKFFGTTAAMGGWRVAIVDCAEDMNRQAANALLKMLEEPPAKSLFLIVSHQPGRLLPTIRSRCRLLSFHPLTHDEIVAGLEVHGQAPSVPETRNRILDIADGSLRRALMLTSDAGTPSLALQSMLNAMPRVDPQRVRELAQAVGAPRAEPLFAAVFSDLRDWIARSARDAAKAGKGTSALAPYIEVWETIDSLGRETEALNLDRRQAFTLAISEIETLTRARH